MRIASAALIALALAGAAAAQQAEPADALLASARLWQSNSRADLARVALEKYLHVVPDDAHALLMLGELEVRSNHAAVAGQLLARLRAAHPQDPAVRYLEDAIRIGTRDRLKMATVERLAQVNRQDEAVAQLQALFPQGPAGGELGIAYNRVLSSSAAHQAEGDAGFRRLVHENPGDPLYQQALGEHLVRRDSTRAEGLRLLAALGRRGDVNHDQAMQAWRDGVQRLGPGASSTPLVREYLAAAPDDQEVREQFERAQRAQAQSRARAADPVVQLTDRGVDDLDHSRLQSAEQELTQAYAARPSSGEIAGALGRLRLRQERYAEARTLLQQAERQDRAHAPRWHSLLAEIDFREELQRADAARTAGDLLAAGHQARAALGLRPTDADALTVLADVEAQRGQTQGAEGLYRKALAREPDHGRALRGLLRLLESSGRRQEALALVDELHRQQPQQAAKLNDVRAGLLREEADAALAAGRGGDGLRLLEQAQAMAPSDPWIRYDLAKLYLRLGLQDEARALMAEGVALRPNDSDIHYAYALLLSSLNDGRAARAELQQVPPAQRSASMNSLQQRLEVDGLRDQAASLALAGDRSGAARLLEQAAVRARDDAGLIAAVASSYVDAGLPQEGLKLMRAWMVAHAPVSPDVQFAWARLLNHAQADAELASALDQLNVARLAPEDRAGVGDMRLTLKLRQAEALAQRQRYADALGLLRRLERSLPDHTRVLAALADVLEQSGDYAQARAIDEKLIARNAGDLDARLARARVLRKEGAHAAAAAELDEVLRRAPAGDIDDRLAVVRQRLALDDVAAARAALAPLLALPTPAVLAQAGRVERDDHRYNEAAAYFRRAGDAEDLAELEQRRHGFIAAGTNYSDKPGDAGISQYRSKELAIEARLAQGYDGHWFALVDPTKADAGALPVDYDGAGLYGKNAAYGNPGFVGGLAQSAKGTAVGLGWESDDWRLDLGTTPIGFPVQDVVGGVRYDGRIGELNYTLDAARRPLTSSLLSYAGARDPVTGEVWGGARSNGVDTRLAYYGARFSSSAALGLHQITGRNLPGNAYHTARIGGDWRFYDAADMRLYAGLAATYWGYGQNLSHYTFGQGGYYSPQSYVSLALPLEWTGRWGDLSYRLRGSGSISHTRENDSPFFPHDPALQAMAMSVAVLPQGYSTPVFGGSSGSGHGYSLAGNAEYRLLPRWFIGALFQIDRSAYYTPNFLSAYLRYDFDLQPGPVVFPPRPVRSYSQF